MKVRSDHTCRGQCLIKKETQCQSHTVFSGSSKMSLHTPTKHTLIINSPTSGLQYGILKGSSGKRPPQIKYAVTFLSLLRYHTVYLIMNLLYCHSQSGYISCNELVIRYSWNRVFLNTVFLKKHINVAYEQIIILTNAFSAVIV